MRGLDPIGAKIDEVAQEWNRVEGFGVILESGEHCSRTIRIGNFRGIHDGERM